MISFALAVLLLVATPGPGVLSLAGVSAAFGYRHGLRYMLGLWIGNNLVALAVLSGLAAIVLGIPWLRTTLAIASALYLVWLASKIAFAGSRIALIERVAPPGIPGGIMLQIINPKAYAVSTVIFSNFPFLPSNLFAESIIKLMIFNVLWIAIHTFWLWLGVTLRELNLPPGKQRAINIAMALAMLSVVALALLAQAA